MTKKSQTDGYFDLIRGRSSMSEYLEEPKNPGLDDGKCALCKVDKGLTDEDRCHGCGYLICDAHFGDPWGKHLVVAHDDEAEE